MTRKIIQPTFIFELLDVVEPVMAPRLEAKIVARSESTGYGNRYCIVWWHEGYRREEWVHEAELSLMTPHG